MIISLICDGAYFPAALISAASKKAGRYMLKDENGGWAMITIKNVYQSNGVIHVIDHVVLPK